MRILHTLFQSPNPIRKMNRNTNSLYRWWKPRLKKKFNKNTLYAWITSTGQPNALRPLKVFWIPLKKKTKLFTKLRLWCEDFPIKPSTIPGFIYSLNKHQWYTEALLLVTLFKSKIHSKIKRFWKWRKLKEMFIDNTKKDCVRFGQLPTTLYFSSKALWCKRNPILSPPCGVLYSALYKNGIFRPILIYYYITSR